MQILGLGAEVSFSIYKFVMKLFDGLLVLASDLNETGLFEMATKIRENLYVLIAIFMLFRLGLSLINYLINPDSINDKQVGGSKLVSRIIVSFILLLSLPLIFDLTQDLQSSILGEGSSDGGLINRIFNVVSIDKSNASNQTSFLLDNVNAVSQSKNCNWNTDFKYLNNGPATGLFAFNDSLLAGCKYNNEAEFKKLVKNKVNEEYEKRYPSVVNNLPSGVVACSSSRTSNCYEVNIIPTATSEYSEDNIFLPNGFSYRYTTNKGILTLNFKVSKTQGSPLLCYYRYDSKEMVINDTTGKKSEVKACGTNFVKIKYNKNGDGVSFANTDWYLDVDDTSSNEQAYSTLSFNQVANNIFRGSKNDIIKSLNNGECPKIITDVKCDSNRCYSTNDGKVKIGLDNKSSNDKDLVDGTSNYNDFLISLKQCEAKPNSIVSSNVVDRTTDEMEDVLKKEGCGSGQGCNFAKQALMAFVEGDELIEDFNGWPYNSKQLAKNIARDNYPDGNEFHWFIATICGVVILGFLFVVSIELILRTFKLFVLQILAPVPIISYMNPNDKMFDGWVKQYIGTYLDLFIKLIGVELVSVILGKTYSSLETSNLLLSIGYILAAVVFMKLAPDFISKLLGIKDMGGTFKDSMKMLKTGSTVALGGAAGAIGGAISGISAFRATKGQSGWNRTAAAFSALGTGVSSTFSGFSSGSKGKVMGGYKHATDVNARKQGLYEQGYNAGNVMLSGLTRGIYDPNKKDEKIETAFDQVLSKRKAMDDHLNGKVEKNKTGYTISGETGDAAIANGLKMQQLKTIIDKNEINGRQLTTAEDGALRKTYAEHIEAAKAHYMYEQAQNKRNGLDYDKELESYVNQYNDTVDMYATSIGKKDAPSNDEHYKYDFTDFVKTDQIISDIDNNGGQSNVAIGKTYKATKDKPSDGKAEFSGSSTRRNHVKVPKDK